MLLDTLRTHHMSSEPCVKEYCFCACLSFAQITHYLQYMSYHTLQLLLTIPNSNLSIDRSGILCYEVCRKVHYGVVENKTVSQL